MDVTKWRGVRGTQRHGGTDSHTCGAGDIESERSGDEMTVFDGIGRRRTLRGSGVESK